VTDNGRGIPATFTNRQSSALENLMTTLHRWWQIRRRGWLQSSGGLHGVGRPVFNALSIYCKAIVHKDGGIYFRNIPQGMKKVSFKNRTTQKGARLSSLSRTRPFFRKMF